MRVQKRKKDLVDYIDSLTMKRIKCIIWLCIIVSVLSEFLPDYTQLFPGATMYKVVVNIQKHRDFFTNIFLGCFGSAIISYVILFIPYKEREKDRIDALAECYKSIICSFLSIDCYFDSFFKGEDIAYLENLEDRIKLENECIKVKMQELEKYYRTYDKKLINADELYEICEKQIMPISKNICVFYEVLEMDRDIDVELGVERKSVNKQKKIFEVLYMELKENFKLETIKQRLIEYVPNDVVGGYMAGKIGDTAEIYLEEAEKLKYTSWYYRKLTQIYSSEFK